MTTWSLFATLYTGLITPLMAQLQAMIGTVCSTMQPIALVMLTIWLAFVGADIAFGHKTLPAACKDFAVAACVIVLLQAGQYTQYISNLFLTAVPHTIGAALGGTTSPAVGLDKVLNLAWTEAAVTYKGLSDWSFKTVGLSIAVMAVLVVSIVAVTYAFLIYMTAAILNVAAVVVGPVFLALAVVPLTRRFAAGWLGVLVGGCTTQLMALAIIQLMSGAELTMMHTLFAPGVASNNNFELLAALAQVGILLGLGGRCYGKDSRRCKGNCWRRLSRLGRSSGRDIRSGQGDYARGSGRRGTWSARCGKRCEVARGRFARR